MTAAEIAAETASRTTTKTRATTRIRTTTGLAVVLEDVAATVSKDPAVAVPTSRTKALTQWMTATVTINQ